MNSEIKAQWTAALRSGKYRQGKGKLASQDGRFCCLGVLCDLAREAGVVQKHERQEAVSTAIYYDDEMSTLPFAVMQWAGLHRHNPAVLLKDQPPYPANGGRTPLAAMNDEDKSFTEIADIIEEYF